MNAKLQQLHFHVVLTVEPLQYWLQLMLEQVVAGQGSGWQRFQTGYCHV